MKRVTAAQSADAQPCAAHRPVFFHGLTGVAGTGRVKPAVHAQERADKPLVTAERCGDCPGDYRAHCRILCQCVLSDWFITLLSSGFTCCCARTTMSSPVNLSACVRKLSRMVRLTLFLDTAVFTAFLDIARPRRAKGLSFLRARTTNCESLERLDFLNTFLKSAALFSLCFRRKRLKRTSVSCLWLCVTSGSAARPWCACERENHGVVSALYCWAGMCVSLAICSVFENRRHFTFLYSGLSMEHGVGA